MKPNCKNTNEWGGRGGSDIRSSWKFYVVQYHRKTKISFASRQKPESRQNGGTIVEEHKIPPFF